MMFCLSLCLLLPKETLWDHLMLHYFVPECIRVPRRQQEGSSCFVMLQKTAAKSVYNLMCNCVVISKNLAIYLYIHRLPFSMPLSFHTLKPMAFSVLVGAFWKGWRGWDKYFLAATKLSKTWSRIKWLYN